MFKHERSASIRNWMILLLCLVAGVFLVSCRLFKIEMVNIRPLSMPGAEYVGMDTCIACHEAEHKYFELTEHASVTIALSEDEQEEGQMVEGCETCHGPGSLHVESRGAKNTIIRANAETACYKCHLDVKGQFMLQYHHPVPEGRMFCTDCHDMHGSDVRATGGVMLLGKDEKCFKCHKEMRGPFVFEHAPVRVEGCTSCHTPHGSINAHLLKRRQERQLCLECHVAPEAAGIPHPRLGFQSSGECSRCHVGIHGSNFQRQFLR